MNITASFHGVFPCELQNSSMSLQRRSLVRKIELVLALRMKFSDRRGDKLSLCKPDDPIRNL